MSEIHITLHDGAISFNKIKEVVEVLESLGYFAEMSDNGTIILNTPKIADRET